MEIKSESNQMIAEFDMIADDYYKQHKENLAITGEAPEYFSEYKVADLDEYIRERNVASEDIFDFGCGIGNSIEYLRQYFPQSNLFCGDVSMRSIEIAKSRFPGEETYIQIGNSIPLPSESFDIVFTACVFHHIPHEEHEKWLSELKRITRPGGILAVYEHNPLNPLTVRAVNNCPIDVNARLIRSGAMKQRVLNSSWIDAKIEYKLFFPSVLRFFRPFEKYLSKFFLGAQWRLIAKK
jgi:SAM-dependent methyltransferase